MLADRCFGFPPLRKKANKVLQRWRVLAFYRIASCLTGNTGTRENGNTGTREHRNTETLWNTSEHPRAPRNTGTAEKPRNTEFDDVVLFPITDNEKK